VCFTLLVFLSTIFGYDFGFRLCFHKQYAFVQTKSGKDKVMKAKDLRFGKGVLALLAVAFMAMLVFSPLTSVKATEPAERPSEYSQFVHTYTNSTQGDWTSVGKPMFPVFFNDSQIKIGSNWSITEPLAAGHSYHVYMYGGWVNNGSEPKTDYDIYVYDPRGMLESEHTEAAGLPEHLGTRTNDTFFTPARSGNYTFVIVNDARESKGAENATFMAIENVQPDNWFTCTIEGKKPDDTAMLNTSWAYEFVTNSPQIEVYVKVPVSLDMYEARLYRMSNPDSLILNSAPLPWEAGLYGNLTENVGGYNLNSEGYRGVAYASCEYKGEDMYLSYNATANATSTDTNSTLNSKTLYELVLIGEVGYGNVDFLVKTQFDGACLLPTNATQLLGKVAVGKETSVSYLSNSTDLINAVLDYSTNQWNSTTELPMKIENRTCTANIPAQKTGTVIAYRVIANDTVMNTLSAEGTFTIKQNSLLDIIAHEEKVYVGQNVTIEGILTGVIGSVPVKLQFMNAQATYEYEATTLENGTFTIQLPTNSTGTWALQASYDGDNQTFPAFGNQLAITVEEQPFLAKNGMFLGAGGFFGVVALFSVYYVKKLRQ
jgi:hypothetical protein